MLLFQHDKLVMKSISFLVLILSSLIAFCQLGDQSIFAAAKLDLDWGYAPKMKLVGGLKNEEGFLLRQDYWNIPIARRNAILAALKDVAKQGLASLDCKIKESFETLLNHPEKTNHSEILIEYCYIQEYSDGIPMGMGSDVALNIIKIFPRIWAYQNGKCLNGAFLHELLHFAGFGEDIAYPCSHKVFPCVPLDPKYAKECKCPNGGDKKKSSPGNDRPDDNYSSASPRSVEVVYESLNPELLVLKNGYWEEAGAYMNKLGRRFSYIEPDQSPLEMKDPPPVLYIPSGGLYGLENSEQFKSSLRSYVEAGGTVLVFSQQHGYEYAALPRPDGKTVGAFGWREDQSCWMKSIYVDTWHPALSSVTTPDVAAPVDGYISDYPDNATVLLRRTRNGEPALVAWKVGAGQVIASSLFTDYQGGISDQRIVRDLITWAKNPNLAIPEYNLGQNASPEVSLNLEIKNISETAASKAKLFWLDPDRNVRFEEERLVSIPAGEMLSLSISHTFSAIPNDKLGIWHVDYELCDTQGEVIQPQAETDSGRFIISKPPIELYELPELTCNITTADENVMRGARANFQVHFANRSDQDKKVSLYWDWQHGKKYYWDEVVIEANSSLTKGITVDLPQIPGESFRFWVWVLGENGKTITNASKGITIITPSIATKIQIDKEYYNRGETVAININLQNLKNVPYDSAINLRIMSPLNQIVYEDSFTAHFEANGAVETSRSFILSQDAQFGSYLIYVEALETNQGKIGGISSLFEIPIFQIKTESQLPSILQPNSSNVISLALTNIGKVEISAGNIELRLLDPQDQLIFQNQQIFSLALGQKTVLNFSITLSDIRFGNYKLISTLSDEFGVRKSIQEVVLSEIDTDLNFDKNFYRMREEMNISLNLINSGKFLEAMNATVNIPSLQYSETKPLTLNPEQTGNLSYSTTVPLTILSGLHSAEVTLILPSGSEIKKKFHFAIPEPDLKATFDPQKDYSWGENLNFKILNSGGIDTSFKYRVTLTDIKTGKETYAGSGDGVVQAGSTIGLSFTIPFQAVKGEYLVRLELEDSIGKKLIFFKNINILGLEADLEVRTDKDIYLNTENITALSKVINSDKEITDGTLHLQVVNKNKLEEWKNYLNPLVFPIETIAIDNDNNVWIGVNKIGAVKFDGYKWKTYLNESSHLSGDYVSAIAQDKNGNLWFGTGLSGVRKFDGTNWTTYNRSNSGLASNQIATIAPDVNGSIWFGTWGGGSQQV